MPLKPDSHELHLTWQIVECGKLENLLSLRKRDCLWQQHASHAPLMNELLEASG